MADSNVSYLKLITSEYATKPKFNAFVEMFLKKVSPINDCLTSFDTIFNIDNAIGEQLDQIGSIVGISRELPISDPDIPGVLGDDIFRQVIKARIYTNFWDGTIKGLYDITEKMIPGAAYQVVDNQDMSMQFIIILPNADPTFIALLLNGYILPKPSGVKINYAIQEKALFGWNSDTAFVKGWDNGIWNTA